MSNYIFNNIKLLDSEVCLKYLSSAEEVKVHDMLYKASYTIYEKEKDRAEVDPDIAVKFLINGITRDVLIDSICYKDSTIISALKDAELYSEERLKLIGKLYNKSLAIELISENKLTADERYLLISKNLDCKFAHQYIKVINEISEAEEKHLVKCFKQNLSVANDLFKSDIYKKFSKDGINKIKESIFKDSNQARIYIKHNPNASDRKEAFQSIIKTAKDAYNYMLYEEPTKSEKVEILKKLALSRTYLAKLFKNYYLINNHDKKIIAQTIFKASDLHQAKFMINNCSDNNIQIILEPLKLAITLIK